VRFFVIFWKNRLPCAVYWVYNPRTTVTLLVSMVKSATFETLIIYGLFKGFRHNQKEINTMAFYECMYIARQELSPTAVEELTKNLQKIITDNGGKVHKTDFWGLKSFAYTINKQKKGHYVLMELDTPPAALLEMERIMRLNEDVVRNLTIKLDELSSEDKEKEAA
tara:strand:+ start:1042 stop:1539 length:498 start_codon:yes stop_codon:yes gene_type:complete